MTKKPQQDGRADRFTQADPVRVVIPPDADMEQEHSLADAHRFTWGEGDFTIEQAPPASPAKRPRSES